MNTQQITSKTLANNKALIISVEGFFNGNVHKAFRDAYESQTKCEKYAVSLKHCAGVDSAGLGLLLLLRDYAQVDRASLLITDVSPEVNTVLRYANFDQIFTIV